jgi:hypothetical protein
MADIIQLLPILCLVQLVQLEDIQILEQQVAAYVRWELIQQRQLPLAPLVPPENTLLFLKQVVATLVQQVNIH